MANEKRLIDANALIEEYTDLAYLEFVGLDFVDSLKEAPTVDAVEVQQYKALVDMYHELRENFIDYYCSGIRNVAPYCLNRCEECVDKYGWCKQDFDKCKGFNPAEVILDGERRSDG